MAVVRVSCKGDSESAGLRRRGKQAPSSVPSATAQNMLRGAAWEARQHAPKPWLFSGAT